MDEKSEQQAMVENIWRTYLTTGEYYKEARQRRLLRMLPGDPRCKSCYAPFQGISSRIVKFLYGKHPSNMNPHMCNACEEFARQYQGGAEIELTLLFADVRGSTALAERMTPTEFSRLINRFYGKATEVMVHSDALIDKIIGDQVAGMYVPGFAGKEHARVAVEAAGELLRATGHGGSEDPWIPLGVGVHTGLAFVGSMVSSEGTTDITVLGDTANTAARLSSVAKVGEILVSASACEAANLSIDDAYRRELELKGKSEPLTVYVLSDYR